jgi:hypothetical protein
MNKKQQLSQLSEVERNARSKGHYARARNVREVKNELEPHKAPTKKAAAKKAPAKKAAPAAKKAPAKKAPAKKTAAKKA